MWFRTIFRRKDSAPPPVQAGSELKQLSLSPRVLAHLDRLQIRSTRFLRGSGAGQRSSTRRRPAANFREHRKYVSGDDVRFVDWRASARSEQIYLKQGEQPQETDIHLVLDNSASMGWGNPPKSHALVRLAAALGYLALSSDDRLHIIPFVKPGASGQDQVFKGKGQFPALWNHLRRLEFSGRTDLQTTLQYLAGKNRGGLVLVLSDLLDIPNPEPALALLPRPAWEVTLIHLLHPAELAPELYGNFQMQDSESGAIENYDVTHQALETYRLKLEAWRGTLEMACIESKAMYSLISTGQSLEKEILPQLHRSRILEPAA